MKGLNVRFVRFIDQLKNSSQQLFRVRYRSFAHPIPK